MKFFSRSVFILLLLYGLVFAVGDMYLMHEGAPLWSALAFPIVMAGIQYLIGPFLIRLFLSISWDHDGTKLPARNREFIEKLCAERGLKTPRIGIIYSGTPNAFSFGRVRSDASVVVTSGLLEILSPEEANAVLAHEIGHVEHWDFLVMTIAAVAPLVLYQLYVFTERISNLRLIAYTSYLCYLVSQFIVLMLNRTREYWADHYAGEVTRAPDVLSSALVKIAYGMVRAEGQYREAMATGDKEEKKEWRRRYRLGGTLALMGISNFRSGAALALGTNPADAAAVMRWDLVNPWARLYELNSTHPLTALRVRQLNEQTVAMQQPLQYPLPANQRIRWGSFPLEVFLWAAPFLAALVLGVARQSFLGSYGIVLPADFKPYLLMFIGTVWILRTLYRYRGTFENATVSTLLEDVDVSQMRPRPVRLKGTILGRGVPGAFWSPDLVLRDPTGIIFLLYRQSIPFARFLFGTTEAETYIGQEVEVEGWFRRGLTPYVEMSRIAGDHQQVHRMYSRWIQLGLALCAVVVGWFWLLS
jgi:heat shock protein HtpX